MSAVIETTHAQALTPSDRKPSLLAKFAGKYSVEPNKMLETLKMTCFRQTGNSPPVTNEQMIALLIVADQYELNPFTKEIYAFPDKGGIVPVLGVDGWSRIINSHPQFDGLEFDDGPLVDGKVEWVDCTIYRKDRSRPTKVREYMAECKRGTQPWQSHPNRMLRHKALIQCGRVAFSFAGIYDPDEATQIIEGESRVVSAAPAVADLNKRIASRTAAPDPLMVSNAPSEVLEQKPVQAVDPVATAVETKPVATIDQHTGEILPESGSAPTYAELEDMLKAAKTADEASEVGRSMSHLSTHLQTELDQKVAKKIVELKKSAKN